MLRLRANIFRWLRLVLQWACPAISDGAAADAESGGQLLVLQPRMSGCAKTTERSLGSLVPDRLKVAGAHSGVADSSARQVAFSVTSHIWFYQADAAQSYCRTVGTKGFDGPSGHKVRRWSDWGISDEESQDEEEEWEESCDHIAELMGQERHLLLWSASW